ncbi:MAG: hypothetical protein KJ067_04800 [Vicinamibacteria bacterium]|nr:hypothetical protein [Vicinamibacteria bacterium]
MSAARGGGSSDRWLWIVALGLLGLGLLSVGAAVAGYFYWFKPRQEQVAAGPEAPAGEPAPEPGSEEQPADPAPEPLPTEEAAEPAAAPAPEAPAPTPRPAATRRPPAAPRPTPPPAAAPAAATAPRTGRLSLEVEAVQDHFASDAVDAMKFEVRLGEEAVGQVEVRFGARGVARQNGRGQLDLSKLPLGDHLLTLSGGPAGGAPVRGSLKVHVEDGARLKLMAKVRYMSVTDRELRFR